MRAASLPTSAGLLPAQTTHPPNPPFHPLTHPQAGPEHAPLYAEIVKTFGAEGAGGVQ